MASQVPPSQQVEEDKLLAQAIWGLVHYEEDDKPPLVPGNTLEDFEAAHEAAELKGEQ